MWTWQMRTERAGGSVVDAFDGKHDAPQTQRVRRRHRRIDLDQFWIVKLRQLKPPMVRDLKQAAPPSPHRVASSLPGTMLDRTSTSHHATCRNASQRRTVAAAWDVQWETQEPPSVRRSHVESIGLRFRASRLDAVDNRSELVNEWIAAGCDSTSLMTLPGRDAERTKSAQRCATDEKAGLATGQESRHCGATH